MLETARSAHLLSARSRALLVSLGLLALLPACSVQGAPADASFDASLRFGEGGLDAPRDSPDTGPLTEGEMVGALHAIHEGDLQVTRFMAANTVRADVMAFAVDLTARHTAADASLLAAASAAGVTIADSVIRQRQVSLRMQELEAVTTESCTARDERYLGFQRLVSGEALSLIDDNFLPAAASSALRTEIETTRAIVLTQSQGLPVPDGAIPEASMPNWEAGVPVDSGCPSTELDAYIDVGTDA